MAFDKEVGQPGKRNATVFEENWDQIWDRIGALPQEYEIYAKRVIRVLPDGSGIGVGGDIEFGPVYLTGGFLYQFDVPNGNQDLSIANAGNRAASRNASNVTWKLPKEGPTGAILPWIQLGNGIITFAVKDSATPPYHPDGHTKSSGLYSAGWAEIVDQDGSDFAIWKLSGETSL